MAASKKKTKTSATRKKATGSKRRTSSSVDRKVYKSLEITATSPDGYSDAIRVGVAKARQTVRRLSWWEVTDLRGRIDPDTCEIDEFQVSLCVHFEVE